MWTFLCLELLASVASLFLPMTSVVHATGPTIVITEIMANPLEEDTGEFVELVNLSGAPVDLAGWQLTDGDALDTIRAWSSHDHGVVEGVTRDQTLLPAGGIAIILDSEYLQGSTRYIFHPNTLLVTVENTTLGDGFTSTDPLTLFDPASAVTSTYGTPVDAADWRERDDNGTDKVPLAPLNGSSVERIEPVQADEEAAWIQSANEGGSPGSIPTEQERNHPPVANAGPDVDGVVGKELTLDGSDSVDADGDALTYNWDLGNGSTASGAVVKVTYSTAGSYDVKLTVADAFASASDLLIVRITEPPTPPAPPSPPSSPSNPPNSDDKQPSEPDRPEAESPPPVNPAVEQATVWINEVLPDPTGSDTEGEWIELILEQEQAVDLAGWKLVDGSTTFLLPKGSTASPFLVVARERSKIALNNTGEKLFLVSPAGRIVQGIEIPSAKEGEAFARKPNTMSWDWTEPTKGATNIFTEQVTLTEPPGSSPKISNPAAASTPVSLEGAAEAPARSRVEIEGVVSVPPGVLGRQFFYIWNGTAGMQIFSSPAMFPDLDYGDTVRVRGKKSTAQGEEKINVAAIEDIEVVAAGGIVPDPLSGTLDLGALTQIHGSVDEFIRQRMTVTTDSGTIIVFFPRQLEWEPPKIEVGAAVTVTGIVRNYSDGPRVLPRMPEDLQTETPTETIVLGAQTEQSADVNAPTSDPEEPTIVTSKDQFPWWAVIVLTLIAAGCGYEWWRRKKSPSIPQ
jgi:hypothetical protein